MSFIDHTPHDARTSYGLLWDPVGLEWIKATLPSSSAGGGDASAANQLLGNASLASLDTKTPALGQALAALSRPVVLTAAQITTLTPPAAIAGYALEAGHLAAIDTATAKIPSQGQALAAASTPVVLTAIQVAAITPPAAITGYALESTQGSGNTLTGAVTETAPATDTASSGLNGRLQRIAQRISSLITALGSPFQAGGSIGNTSFGATLAAETTKVIGTVNIAAAQTVGLLAGVAEVGNVKNSGTFAVQAAATLAAETTKVIGTVNVAASQTIAVTQATPANLQATVTQIALTKGTQGSTGVSTQHLRDAGRNTRIFMLDAFVAAPATEAVQTVVQWYGNAAVAGTATPAVVPAGKTLRLTGWRITYRSIATFGSAIVRIRCNTAGAGVLASPMVASFEAGANLGATTVSIVGAVTTETGEFPEGLEIPAAAGLAFSMAGYGPTGTLTLQGPVRFEVHGYEY